MLFFNEIHLDALSYSHDALLDSLMPLPMMADRKLITVSGLDINAMRSNELDDLCAVMAKLEDYDYNTVILNVASDKLDIGYSLKKPSAQLKKLGECAILVNFEKNSPSKLAAWLAKHFEHNGVAVSPQICTMIIDRCGRDMYNLAGESEKLSFYAKAHGRNEILPEDVTLVTSPLFEYDSFAFANAICARRKDEALEILRDMKTRRIEPVIILAEISKNVCYHIDRSAAGRGIRLCYCALFNELESFFYLVKACFPIHRNIAHFMSSWESYSTVLL